MSMAVTDVAEERLRTRVRELIIESAPEAADVPIEDAHLVEDLGYHSLAILELGFALEEEFDLALVDADRTVGIRTTREVEDFVLAQMRAEAADRPEE